MNGRYQTYYLPTSCYLFSIAVQVQTAKEKLQQAAVNYEDMINENTEREKRRFELIGERYDKLDEHIQNVNTLIDTVCITVVLLQYSQHMIASTLMYKDLVYLMRFDPYDNGIYS